MKENKWCVIAVTALDIECNCKKEFEVSSKSLRGAVIKAENKIKKEMGGHWQGRAVWGLDPDRGVKLNESR